MPPTPIRDPYNRPVTSLRISLTQRCNFECFFCHQEGEHNPGTELTPAEIEEITATAASLGITKIKLTGGEPLLRKDLAEIIQRINKQIPDISLTTNASLLTEQAYQLQKAGLKRVNVSFHSLKPDAFCKVTGQEYKGIVRKGIQEAIECGLDPVKLNMVVMKGINDDEVPEMIEFSGNTGTILQLIEFQELENGVEHYGEYHVDLKPIEEMLEKESVSIHEREMHRRKVYSLKNGATVEVVRPMHNSEFCAHCTRLRVTSDGRLKACLMRDDNLVSLVSLIRSGEPRERLVEAFKASIACREPFWKEEK